MLAAAGVDPALIDQKRVPSSIPAKDATGKDKEFSKPLDFQRNPGAVKALLLAAGKFATIMDSDAHSFEKVIV